MTPSVVPTPATLRAARRMVMAAKATDLTGVDAVLRHLRDVSPDQSLALLAVLVDMAAIPPSHGPARRMTDLLSDEEMRRCHSLHNRGESSPEIDEGERQYQRVKARRQRERRALQADAVA